VTTMALIRLTRDAHDWTERFRAYRVLIDGERVATVRRGETVQVTVAPGSHRVQVALDWGRSEPLTVQLGAGEELALRCFTAATPLNALYRATLGRRRYLGLEPVAR
jgi:hypothetical protein